MSKIIMASVIVMTIVAPILAARDASATRGLKKTTRWMIYFLVAWVFSLAYLYGRLF